MTEILLNVKNDDIRRQIKRLIAPEYNVTIADRDGRSKWRTDLLIIDDEAYDASTAKIEETKSLAEPLFLPVVLVTRVKSATAASNDIWRHVDEVVETTAEETEFRARMESLLRTRDLSKKAHDGFSPLLDALDYGIGTINTDHLLTRQNTALAKMLGNNPGDPEMKICENLFLTDSCLEDKCPVYRVLNGESHVECERTIYTGLNKKAPALITVSAIRGNSGRLSGAIVTVKDLSNYKFDEEERLRMQKRIFQIEKQEVITHLTGSLAHYFNNIMAVILSNAYFGQKELGDQHPVNNELQAITDSGKKIVSVIDQLQSLSGRQILRPQMVNLNDLLGGLEDQIRETAGPNVEVSLSFGDNLHLIDVDEERLRQLVLDMVATAGAAMPDGGKLELATENAHGDFGEWTVSNPSTGAVILEITDDRPGLEPYEVDRIFDPIFSSKMGNRTGLELAVASGTITQSGGHIGVESGPGQRTAFRIMLPAVSLESLPARYPKSTGMPGPGMGKTVLLVDDEKMVRQAAKRMLKDNGYIVLEAEGGDEAVALFDKHKATVDVLLTDVVMPEMNGKELADKLLALNPELKVVYMSGYGDDIVTQRGVLPVNVIFVRKPFSANQILISVWDALHMK